MNKNVTVTPRVGYYLVITLDSWGVQTHIVGKDKRCSCGGTKKQSCRHIKAVAQYLRDGGDRAPKERPLSQVRENGPLSSPASLVPATCPICDTLVEQEERGRWRCPNNPSHYFRWRGDQGIRQFLTQGHPNKLGAFYDMNQEERKAFLEQSRRRLHSGGYSPFS